jgi:hypothetical protein
MDSHYLIDTYASSESILLSFPDLQESYTQLISHYLIEARSVPVCLI